ncbi:MAG: UDP-3-O-[3-hydroxymyristoyl] N-acetylglucosamine deacetylase [Planctomycetes bacterium]|nr:UDP-3-O-[3-hydroxymyristoyl] N-acetylglucosamine deacetylase [Planctomycetota bacterium]
MKIVSHRQQRTISRPADVHGTGFLTGKTVHLRFRPAPANTGVVFVRADLGPRACIAAHVDNVTGTHRRTTLGDGPLCVGLVEHVLSALGALRIDNCMVEVNAPEPPGLDGSAQGFLDALLAAGIANQAEHKNIWAVETSVIVRNQEATLCLHPPAALELRASYLLDFGNLSPIHRQVFTNEITPESFAADIACCRTFLLEEDAIEMRKQGYGSRSGFTDLLVFGKQGPIGNRLRFANEPARHKVLDLIGDLALLGEPICGHLVAYRSGHPLNIELVHLLHQRLAQVLPRRRLAA